MSFNDMDFVVKLSDKLSLSLEEVEKEIKRYIENNDFYLTFESKSWTACTAGQTLLTLTMIAINLRYDIENLKRYGL